MGLSVAFIMDPLEGVNVRTDTSFAFMEAAQRRGHRLIHVAPKNLSLLGDTVQVRGHVVRVQRQQGSHFQVVEPIVIAATELDAIFIRTDPPFDGDYLMVTWLLSFAERAGVQVVNSPAGIRSANEKLYAQRFASLCPRTLVTSHKQEVLDFMTEKCGGTAIAKPLDGHGGFGVVKLSSGDSNVNALIDMLTTEGKEPMLIQNYLPEAATEGDKRLLVVDGVLKGAVRRMPQDGDHRGNVHVGGVAEACEITQADHAIVDAMSDELRADGLFFVGLDVIGGKLIEVNVTSPTLVQELRDLGGPDLADEIIAAVESRAEKNS